MMLPNSETFTSIFKSSGLLVDKSSMKKWATGLTCKCMNFMGLIAVTFCVASTPVWGQLKMRYGGEPTFANEEILSVDVDKKNADGETYHWHISTEENQRYINLMKDEVQKRCPDCEITKTHNKHFEPGWAIKHPTGVAFQITPDPSVVEIIVSPQFIEFFETHKKLYSSLIFGAAKAVGLRVHFAEGQGHITMMMQEVFAERPLLFRNFVADTVNHPELGLGIFEYNPLDSPPAVLTPGLVRDLKAEIGEVDGKEGYTSGQIAYAVDEAYERHPKANVGGETHYQALRVYNAHPDRFGSGARVESRAFRPQKDFDEFLQQIKLIEARVNYLATIEGKVRIRADEIPTIGQAKTRFRKYVQESGLDWNDYKTFIPENWRQAKMNTDRCTEHLKVVSQYDFIFRD